MCVRQRCGLLPNYFGHFFLLSLEETKRYLISEFLFIRIEKISELVSSELNRKHIIWLSPE